jgi:hypothetical protein
MIGKLTPANEIVIWQPRYKDRKVLIAKYKIGNHNKVTFTKAKHLAGKEFYISGVDIINYPLEDNGKIACYAVPLDDLEIFEREQ